VHDALLVDARDAANQDFLTGALSRKGFEAVANLRLEEARKQGLELSLLLVDLDHFKSVNDTFGHAGGDAVLREFVKMTQLQLRREDVLGRIGGEEFAVLLPRTAPGEALHLAERLCVAAASQPIPTPSGLCRYSISGGIAGWTDGETFDHLNMRADSALYEAKQSGRNTVRVHHPAGPESVAPENSGGLDVSRI
jgi:diguanylate cyclase (GGDEF)-like protein